MSDNNKSSYGISIFLIGVLFFIFGFITWLNGILIPFLQTACELDDVQAYFVTSAFYISYFVMALPSSAILKKVGFKKGMSLGLVIMAIGSVIFIPAALQRNYAFFLSGLFIQGLGLSILQTASNPYVIILGPEESAARRISIMGVANKVAGAIGTYILAAIVLKNIDVINDQLANAVNTAVKSDLLNELASRIISPYVVITIVLIVLALLIRISPLPNIDDEEANPDTKSKEGESSIFSHTYLFLGALAIFIYVGAEVIAVDSIVKYADYLSISHISILGENIEAARLLPGFTLGLMITGYLIGVALIPKVISQENALKLCTILGVLFSIGIITTSGFTSVFFLAALGLANSLMWPAIWPMSMKGLGKHTKTGAALLIMGIAGGGVIPPLYGKLSILSNSQTAYILMIPCYLYILFFATKGHKIGYKES